MNKNRKALFYFLFSLFLTPCAFAQSAGKLADAPPPATVAAKPAPVRQEEGRTPVSISMPEFLAKYDKFIALGEARAAAEKKRVQYEAAINVFSEQINELGAELRAQIPAGHVWNPKTRGFVAVPIPPAPVKDKEKP